MALEGAEARSSGGAEEIDALGDAYLDGLQSGRAPDRDAIVRAHPDLAQALERRLALLEKLHRLSKDWRESAGYLEILKSWTGIASGPRKHEKDG